MKDNWGNRNILKAKENSSCALDSSDPPMLHLLSDADALDILHILIEYHSKRRHEKSHHSFYGPTHWGGESMEKSSLKLIFSSFGWLGSGVSLFAVDTRIRISDGNIEE